MPDEDPLADFHDGIHQMFDLIDGFRAAAIARGYSPTAAEQMAVMFAQNIIASINAKAT